LARASASLYNERGIETNGERAMNRQAGLNPKILQRCVYGLAVGVAMLWAFDLHDPSRVRTRSAGLEPVVLALMLWSAFVRQR